MPDILLFDVNETLLDVSALGPDFQRIFGSASVSSSWFTQVLQYSLVANSSGPYFDFSSIAGAVLEMTAATQRVALSPADKQSVLDRMLALPPHPDVVTSLQRLKTAGFRMATLTNSTGQGVKKQLQHAGLQDFFEKTLSVDSVQRYKPAPEPYQMAAQELGAPIGSLRLIAAHPWDILGALQVGCKAAFVARKNQICFPLTQKPDIVGNDLTSVTDEILKLKS